MSQDIVADALNQIMNSKKVQKKKVQISRYSNLLINLFEMMKKKGYIDFEIKESDEGKKYISVEIIKLNKCLAVKPRYYVSVSEIEKYLRRFLPSRNFGTLVVSTSKGLMSHQEAEENKLGGTIIAYFY
jgi:small subunit ribosomal protein S8